MPGEDIAKLKDEELIKRFISTTDERYFEELYNRYALKIMQKCYSFSKNEMEAQDMTHDIFLKIMLKCASFSGKSKLSTWIYSITYNFCVDYAGRKSKMFKVEMDAENYTEVAEVDDDELMSISIGRLETLMTNLSPVERSMLLMKYQDGFSIKEIAKITDCGESAVKMKLKRSKEKLKKLYSNDI